MINISLWVIAWTPFAVISLIGIHGNQKLLTPLVSTLPILFAKTSCLYNPIIYGKKYENLHNHTLIVKSHLT